MPPKSGPRVVPAPGPAPGPDKAGFTSLRPGAQSRSAFVPQPASILKSPVPREVFVSLPHNTHGFLLATWLPVNYAIMDAGGKKIHGWKWENDVRIWALVLHVATAACEVLLTFGVLIHSRRSRAATRGDEREWARYTCRRRKGADERWLDWALEAGAVAACFFVFTTQMLASAGWVHELQICVAQVEARFVLRDDGEIAPHPVSAPAWRRAMLVALSPALDLTIWVFLSFATIKKTSVY